MRTSASSFEDAVRETLSAADEIRRHDRLLTPAWRDLVDAVERVSSGSPRAGGTTTRCAPTAPPPRPRRQNQLRQRFSLPQLPRLAPEEPAATRSELPSRFTTVRPSDGDTQEHLGLQSGHPHRGEG